MTDAKSDADETAQVLTINVGSSSIRFAFFSGGAAPERVGAPGTVLSFKTAAGEPNSRACPTGDHAQATRDLLACRNALP